MKILYFDCFAGISGDMALGALLNLGISPDEFRRELKKLNIGGYSIDIKKGIKNGIQGTNVYVNLLKAEHNHEHNHKAHHHEHHHRNLSDILEVIGNSRLNENIKQISSSIFRRLAEAEARVHGTTIDDVHFHEVGAVDAIVDIVGAAICINKIAPDKIMCSYLHTGSGFVKCEHGIIPVPAPATLELIKGIPFYDNDIEAELVTPTGAAIISTICHEWGHMPKMKINSIGYGCGKRDLSIPNVLRVIEGECMETSDETDRVTVIETNIDDMNPEITGFIMDKLFDNGALDVYYTPIYMKKNRPAVKISVICGSEKETLMEDIILKETTAFGLRKYKVQRAKLTRYEKEIDTQYGIIKVKYGERDGRIVKACPEFDCCRKAAEKNNVPLIEVYNAAVINANKEREKEVQQ